jgi:hypothetical protein
MGLEFILMKRMGLLDVRFAKHWLLFSMISPV